MDEEIEGVPPRLVLPSNLFVVGTVNVDETTYLFSPKVLDRANVIEFRVEKDDLADFLKQPRRLDFGSLEGQGKSFAQEFAAAADREVSVSSIFPPIADGAAVAAATNERLLELFAALAPYGWEFGYRVANEIHRFVYWHAVLTGHGWQPETALDAQVVQKIMPKLHGSEHRLRAPLEAVIAFAKTYGLVISEAKATRMLNRLKDGFTSFAES
jgi:5-methylcytosine-specific restriction protein B